MILLIGIMLMCVASMLTAFIAPFTLISLLFFGAAVWIFAAYREMTRLARCVERIARGEVRVPANEWSSHARRVIQSALDVQTRVRALRWRADSRTLRGIPLGADLLQYKREDGELPGREAVYRNLLYRLQESFRAPYSAILLPEKEGSEREAMLLIHGPTGDRFERFLRGELLEASRDLAVPTLRNEILGRSARHGMQLFGVSFSLLVPFIRYEREEPARGVVWFGYDADTPPTALEYHRGRELAAFLTGEFQRIADIASLKGEVERGEIWKTHQNRLMAHVSHDARTPLANVVAVLSILRSESGCKETRSLLDLAIGGCQHTSRLLDNLLDTVVPPMGSRQPSCERAEIVGVVRSVVDEYQCGARVKRLSLMFDSSVDSYHVRMGSSQLRRVFSNIVSNSIKFTEVGTVVVRVRIDEGEAEVEINDTGVGMSEADLEGLFVPRARFHPSMSVSGTGIGLWAARTVLETYKGTIRVVSTPGMGTRVTIRVPGVSGIQSGEIVVAEKHISSVQLP